MLKDLHSMMKVGIVQFMAYPATIGGDGPIIETISKIATDDFFGAIEVTRINDPEIRGKAGTILHHSRLAVGFGAQPVQLGNKLNLNSFDAQERSNAVTRIKELLEQAYQVGAKNLALLSGRDPGDLQRPAALELLVASLTDICSYAQEKFGLGIILEVFDRDVDKCCLIGSTGDAVKVAEGVKKVCSNFGLMIDLSHLPQQRETARESLTIAKDHLVHVHIGNCITKHNNHPAYGDQHPRFGIAEGDVDVPELTEFLKVLLDIGYLRDNDPRVVAFEVRPMQGEEPDLIIANAKRTLREAWARL
ncbi:MAG: TIM barrel protein [Clostridia bacterium]|nr:TIM barrel protein [Clostridia bacterium]